MQHRGNVSVDGDVLHHFLARLCSWREEWFFLSGMRADLCSTIQAQATAATTQWCLVPLLVDLGHWGLVLLNVKTGECHFSDGKNYTGPKTPKNSRDRYHKEVKAAANRVLAALRELGHILDDVHVNTVQHRPVPLQPVRDKSCGIRFLVDAAWLLQQWDVGLEHFRRCLEPGSGTDLQRMPSFNYHNRDYFRASLCALLLLFGRDSPTKGDAAAVSKLLLSTRETRGARR